MSRTADVDGKYFVARARRWNERHPSLQADAPFVLRRLERGVGIHYLRPAVVDSISSPPGGPTVPMWRAVRIPRIFYFLIIFPLFSNSEIPV